MKVLSRYTKRKLIEKLYPELSIKMISDKLGMNPATVHKYIQEKGLRISGDSRLYHLKLEFSKKKGYNNLADAIGGMGFYEFHREFKEAHPEYKSNRR